MVELKGAREQIGRCWSEGNGRLNGGGALICKRWNFRERRDRACRTRNDRTAEKGGKERRTGRRRRCIPRRNAVRKRERRERERVISVIASVYIVPLASGVSRTAFVFGGEDDHAVTPRDRFDPHPLARVAGFRRNVLFPFSQIKARIADKLSLNFQLGEYARNR